MNDKRWLAVLLCAFASCANAQAIYRCGNTYTQEPCPGGTAVAAPVVPSAAESAAARDEAKREAQLAERMHADRVKDEAAQPVSAKAPKDHGVRGGPVRPVIFGKSAPKKDARPANRKEGAAISRPASRAPATAGTSAKGSPGSR